MITTFKQRAIWRYRCVWRGVPAKLLRCLTMPCRNAVQALADLIRSALQFTLASAFCLAILPIIVPFFIVRNYCLMLFGPLYESHFQKEFCEKRMLEPLYGDPAWKESND